MNETQKALLLRAKEAHDAAQLLLEHDLYRDATSRAYYCMFYVAQAFLEEQGMSFSSHKATIAAFGRLVAKAGIVPIELHREPPREPLALAVGRNWRAANAARAGVLREVQCCICPS